ncbi:Sid related protein [Legionella lansingensis]|uniref:Sid related protein n=1 Tax=Legionella lansingensis TaxID=45067 RepID=A0A0W0VZ27_9GAMM|nr:Sid related protein [Legionella lansingensis]SNV48185.1 Sid related protein [Legionella lansingensis]
MPKGRFDTDQSTDTSKEKDPKKKKKTESHNDTGSPLPPYSQLSNHPKSDFTATDFSYLAENEHGRYVPNSKKIGHAVITEEGDKTIALQYELPSVDNDETPVVRPLVNIEAIEPFRGMHRYRAQTPDGHTPMYAKRFISGNVGEEGKEESIQIACFSPSPEEGKPPFWGSIRPTPLFRTDLSKAVKKDLEKDLKEMKEATKGGDELVVEHASVPQRDLIKTRTPDQNTVMGESARDAYEHFFDKMADELHPEMKQRLKRAFTADIKDNLYKNSFRPEWLHLKGWSLMPMSKDPQTKDNLGAGPKWANTQMMILERVVKWFAINAPESLLTIQPKFDMLLDSELIQHIDFKVRIQIKERFVELIQSIDPFQAYPLFPKASDLAQGTAITHNILHHVNPVSRQVVKGVKKKTPTSKSKKDDEQVSSSSILTHTPAKETGGPLTNSTHSQVASQPVGSGGGGDRKRKRDSYIEDELSPSEAKRPAKANPSANSTQQPTTSHISSINRKKRKRDDEMTDDHVTDRSKAKRIDAKPKFPTQNQHERSVVQIYADYFIADYDNPWRDPESSSCSGSGFIVEDSSGKKYIMTNAHVAENSTYIQVRLANNRIKKYEAKVKCVSYQCDLALLEVDDPEFNELVEPVELGDMVSLRQRVMVVGFPMGGTEISLSKGIVSRIQVDGYSMSDQRLLQAQIDAAVNPGNSGGPVFSGNKVVGVAFQGYGGHQGLSYIIPIPVMCHFLIEALGSKKYRGFPTIPIITEELENSSERAFYKMDQRTGIRVVKVDNLSDAYSKLKPDDILLAIDGLPISNEGTVDIPGIGNCIDFFHVTQSKFIGDSVTLRVLRKNSANNATEELDVDVVLDTILGDTEKVSVAEHDKMPTYYFNSGVCFVPLTRNYMEGEGCTFEDMHLVEENCTLPDAPKKNPDEQIIVINTILKCNETNGYEKHIHAIVKEINGKPISNIRDVLLAMEGHKGERHVITLASKSKIVLPNMSPHEHARLLKRHFISHDRSADLVAKPVDAPTKSSTHIARQTDSELHVEDLELTQSGMHALFARMGYPGITSGSVYNGMPTIDIEALNRQGFMPVLTNVGQRNVTGHWIMLIHGRGNQYYLFDPLGQVSGMSNHDILAPQLPRDAALSIIPNGEGLNGGLCGYWIASVGLRVYTAINRAAAARTLPDLVKLGQTITDDMQAELADNGYVRIINWLQSVAARFPGAPATNPIDARDLRYAAEARPVPILSPIPKRPLSMGFFGKLEKEIGEEKSKPKRKRVIESSSEEDEEIKTVLSVEEDVEDGPLTKDMLPGLKRFKQTIDEMEEHYKNLPDVDEEDEEYENSLDENGDNSELASQSEEVETDEERMETDEESMEIDEEDSPQKPLTKLRRNTTLQSQRFFQPPSTGADKPLIEKSQIGLFK